MKKSVIISAVLIALLGLMIWTLASHKKEINKRKDVKTIDSSIAVTVVSAQERETNGRLELVGKTDPDKEVVVAAECVGKIVKINFKLGDFVSKGMVLAKVEDTYKRLAFENAQLKYNQSKEDYERYRVLRKGDAVSDTQLRDMKVTYEGAAIELRDARKQWTDTKIIAPFGGIITSKKAELGAYVSAGTSIAEMANVARLRVSLAVSESNVYKLHKGQKVGVSADVYPGVIYKGAISGISPQGSDSHTYPIEISIANNGRKQLKAGTYVNIHVDMGETKRALMIPRDAIVSSVKDPSVYVVRGGTAHIVRINTGDDSGSYFEVTSGIKEGDLVVINGQINLIDGCRVSVVKN